MSSRTDEPTAAKVDASRPERPDVFISYSRTDEAFVRRLVTALGEGGLDVWVDWEDIRKSADWRTTIERGIEASKVFVPVLSREQIASEICRHENACAAELNKRFVPLVRREVDRAELPEELNKPNWIWFREADDFRGSLDQLSDAIANDNDWLDAHARLLVRASEWERGGRDGSLLLRGGDLRAAEAWLAAQGSHKEHATPLQGAYIAAGRSAAKRRLQVVSGLTLFALAVAVGLAIAAFVQRNSAIENEKTARSRELAVRSAAELRADPELALLIALAAEKAKRTSEAIAALRRALPASRVRTRIETGAPVQEVSVSSDGTLIRTRGSAGIRFWSALSGKRRRGVGLGARFATPAPAHTLFRPAAYCESVTPLSVAYSAAGNLFAVACENGHIRVVDEHNPEGPRFSTNSPDELLPGTSVAMDFSPNGRRLAVAIHPNFSESGGGRSVIGGHSGEVWNTSTGKQVRRLSGHTSLLNAISFDPTGQRIVTASEDKTARVWDAASGRSLFELRGHAGAVTAAAFVGKRQVVVTGSADGTVRLWDVATDDPVASTRLDARTLPAWARPLRPEPTGATATSRDGRYALLGTRDAGGEVVDANDGAHVSTLHWVFRPYHSSFSPDGERILTIGGDANTTAADAPPTVWESVSGRRVRTLGASGYVYAGAFTPDGERIVTGGEDGVVRLWSADEKGGAATVVGRAVGRIVSIAVSPDGRFVAVASRDTSARVWELGRETAPVLLTGQGDDVTGVAFSPDGTLVVTSGADGTARIWSTATGEELLSIPGQASQDVPAYFSGDGRRIVTLDSGDEVAALRHCEVCGDDDEIVEEAQRHVTRELNPAERRAFLGER